MERVNVHEHAGRGGFQKCVQQHHPSFLPRARPHHIIRHALSNPTPTAPRTWLRVTTGIMGLAMLLLLVALLLLLLLHVPTAISPVPPPIVVFPEGDVIRVCDVCLCWAKQPTTPVCCGRRRTGNSAVNEGKNSRIPIQTRRRRGQEH